MGATKRKAAGGSAGGATKRKAAGSSATTKAAPRVRESRGERYCLRCGKLHGSSLIPASEVGEFTSPGAVEPAARYRVFYCGERFLVVPHVEEGE